MTEQRYLIAKIERGHTVNGREVINLYSNNGRLRFPVLVLFDPSMLASVNIDPNTLTDKPIHRRFWAYYETSKKPKSTGAPYLDVLYLEPIDKPTSNPDTNAIMQKLHEIHSLLEQLVTRQPVTGPQEESDAFADIFDDVQITDVPPPDTNPPAMGQAEGRTAFYDAAGSAIASGHVTAPQINALVDDANGTSWPAALAALENLIARNEREQALPVQHSRGSSKLFKV